VTLIPQGTVLFTRDGALDGRDLGVVVRRWISYKALLGVLGLERDERIVDAAIRVGGTDLALLKEHQLVKDHVVRIGQDAQTDHRDLEIRLARIERDLEHDCDKFSFVSVRDRSELVTQFDFDFLKAPEWEVLVKLHAGLKVLGESPFKVQTSHSATTYASLRAALNALEAAAGSQTNPAPPQPMTPHVAPPRVFDWADAIEEEGARNVFVHLAQHDSVSETEVTGFMGSPRAFRRFSLAFEEHARKVPFKVRIEVGTDGKRYVKEGEK
jgi:hypothetical protein